MTIESTEFQSWISRGIEPSIELAQLMEALTLRTTHHVIRFGDPGSESVAVINRLWKR